jgi:trehalose 6-phosphate phosphatase
MLPILLADLRRAVAAAGHVFLALDFDGTLAPIVPRPEDAAMPAEAGERLRELARRDRCTVALVSGRSVKDLRERVGLDLIYAGNHGLEIDGPGLSYLHPDADALRGAIDLASWDLEAVFEAVRGVVVERKGLTTTVHYRQAPSDLRDWITAGVLSVTGSYGPRLTALPARKAWEIRPRVNWNKGFALRFLLGRFSRHPLLMCAGDDDTDEDMFVVSADAISIRIGGAGRTRARYRLETTSDLLSCLDVVLSAAAPASSAA